MFKISDEDIKFWRKYVKDVDKFVKSGDLDGFMIEMDYAMAREGFTSDFELLNDVGMMMQDSYDRICDDNMDWKKED